MQHSVVSADRIVPVHDFSLATLRNLQEHLRVSHTFEHCAYREAELDEVWRLLDMQSRTDSGPALDQIAAMRDIIWQAHDLVGLGRPLDAARVLNPLVAPGEGEPDMTHSTS